MAILSPSIVLLDPPITDMLTPLTLLLSPVITTPSLYDVLLSPIINCLLLPFDGA